MEKSSSKQNNPIAKGKASEFLCLICKDYLKDPVSCSECMDAHFCMKCIQDEFQKNPKCPSCKSSWTDKSIKKIPIFLKVYEKEEVKCPNERCSWSGNIPHYFLHKEECEQKPIFCVFSKYGCSWSGILGEEQGHGETCTFKPFKKFFEIYETESEEIKNKFTKTQAELEELRQKHTKTEAELAELKIRNLKREEELKVKVEEIESELRVLINKIATEASQNCSKAAQDLMTKCTDLKEEMKGLIEKSEAELKNITTKLESELNEGLRKISTEADQKTIKLDNDVRKELKLLDEKQQKLLEKLNLVWETNDVEGKLMIKESFPKIESTVLSTAPHKNKIFKFFKDLPVVSFTLLFRASRDGFGAAAFHSKCDNKGPTLVLVKTKTGYYFGGYAAVDWDSSANSKSAPSSFIFSFNRESKHTVFQNQGSSIDCSSGRGPTFGGGFDIYISSECNNNTNSYSNLGYTYSSAPFAYGSNEAYNHLAGSYYFQVEDYEVFAIKLK